MVILEIRSQRYKCHGKPVEPLVLTNREKSLKSEIMINRPYDIKRETGKDVELTAKFISENLARIITVHRFLKESIAGIRGALAPQHGANRADFTTLEGIYYELRNLLLKSEGITSLRFRRSADRPTSSGFKLPPSFPHDFIDLHEAVKELNFNGSKRHNITSKVASLILGRTVAADVPAYIRNTVYYMVERVLNMVDEARLKEKDFNIVLEALACKDQSANLEIGEIINEAREMVFDGMSVRLEPTGERVFISVPRTVAGNHDRPRNLRIIPGGKR